MRRCDSPDAQQVASERRKRAERAGEDRAATGQLSQLECERDASEQHRRPEETLKLLLVEGNNRRSLARARAPESGREYPAHVKREDRAASCDSLHLTRSG